VATELVTYPGEPHVFVGEAHRADVSRRVLGWFDKYSRPEESGKTQ
jgi:dipeptidyl aminopeptidase/acylaminoacyl peptidase